MEAPARAVALFAVALSGIACGGGQPSPKPPQPTASFRLLSEVPADTPFAAAALTPAPAEYQRQSTEHVLGNLRRSIAALDALIAIRPELAEQMPVIARVIYAAAEPLKDHLTVAKLAAIGLDVNTRWVLYGIGWIPAVRIELADVSAMRKTLTAALPGEAAARLATGEEYWRVPVSGTEELELAVAIDGEVLAAALYPAREREKVVAKLLGTRPEESLARAGTLEKARAANQLSPNLVGYIDPGAYAPGKTAAPEWQQSSAECAASYERITAGVPRVVFGVRSFRGTRARFELVIEIDEPTGAALARTGGAVPALGSALTDSAAALGIGVELDPFLATMVERTGELLAAGADCPGTSALSRFVGQLASVRAALKLSPLAGATGLLLVIDELELSPGGAPGQAKVFAIIGTKKPQRVLTMAAKELGDPKIRSVKAGAKPKRLSIPEYGQLLGDMFIGRASSAVGFSIGVKTGTRLGELLETPSSGEPPLFQLSFRPSFLERLDFALQAPRLAAVAQDDPKLHEIVEDLRQSTRSRYQWVSVRGEIQKRGIVLEIETALRDADESP